MRKTNTPMISHARRDLSCSFCPRRKSSKDLSADSSPALVDLNSGSRSTATRMRWQSTGCGFDFQRHCFRPSQQVENGLLVNRSLWVTRRKLFHLYPIHLRLGVKGFRFRQQCADGAIRHRSTRVSARKPLRHRKHYAPDVTGYQLITMDHRPFTFLNQSVIGPLPECGQSGAAWR